MKIAVLVAAGIAMFAFAPSLLLGGGSIFDRLAAAALGVIAAAAIWRGLRGWRSFPAGQRVRDLRAWLVAAPVAALAGAALATLATAGAVAVVAGDAALAVEVAARAPSEGGWWFLTLVAAVALAWALRRPIPAVAERWCERQGVPVTSESVDLVRRDLRRIRSLRAAGAVIPWVVFDAPAAAYNLVIELRGPGSAEAEALLAAVVHRSEFSWSGFFTDPLVNVLLGYAVGAVIGELTRRSARARGGRGALLETRRSAAYTAPLARWLPGGAAALAALALAVRALIGDAPADAPTTGQLAAGTVIATIIAAAAWAARLWIIRRPQRMVDPVRVAVDDAFRASAVHATAGAASALTLLIGFGSLGGVIHAGGWDGPLWGAARFLVGVGGFALVVGIWLGFGTSYAWRVRRGEPAEERDPEPVA